MIDRELAPSSLVIGLALLATLVIGCGPRRFASLSAGEYGCDAVVVSNTCGSAVTGSSMLVTVEGAGSSTITLLVPDQATVSPSSDGWASAQFGAQADPMSYAINGPATCDTMPTHGYDYMEHATITRLGADELDVSVTYDYRSLLTCGIPGVATERCTLAYAVTCTRVP